MMTPQQIQEISFEKALFGGYDMTSVDEVLEPLTEDYIALYKENSVLKSKMRILVEKLEEYRRQESSMQNAIVAAQKTCDQMMAEAERKCAQMLHEAEETANAKAQNVDERLGSEQDRLELAQRATAQFIDGMEKRLRRQLELMDELRRQELPEKPKEKRPEMTEKAGKTAKRAFDFNQDPSAPTTEEKADALIEEIGHSIDESLQAEAPVVKPVDEPTREFPQIKRFEDLQFGRNYHPGEEKTKE